MRKFTVPAGESTTYTAEVGGVNYAVSWIPVQLGMQGEAAYLEEIARVFAAQPFVLRTRASAEIALAGRPGRELAVQTQVDEMRHRWFISGGRLYQVSVIGPAEATGSEPAARFFASFGFGP